LASASRSSQPLAPPAVIEELGTLIRQELTHPELRRRYRLPRCVMRLFAGVSGSGKTLAIQAIWRMMYGIMSEVTGTPIDQLPPRVFRLRVSEVLSMWLGESDKNLDRFFSEMEQLADEPFVAADGTSHTLPVLGIIEELDGIARARGTDPIYDRILTTLLQRLDATRPELRNKLILYIGTTNEAQHVDRAFLRRIGAKTVQFHRLNRKATFATVLQKHLTALPLCSNNGHTPAELVRSVVANVAAWLFSPNSDDTGIVELTYAGSTTPQVRYRRDFLTGSLVDRAVRQAAEESCQAEEEDAASPGVSLPALVRAFDEQIRSVTEQLNEHNVSHFTDVPDGVRVATLRRVPQPAHTALEFQRN
jgi:SpoVK/Ycf46/Vps4 family AAA+-type ATPase